jgi:hypothetical protein
MHGNWCVYYCQGCTGTGVWWSGVACTAAARPFVHLVLLNVKRSFSSPFAHLLGEVPFVQRIKPCGVHAQLSDWRSQHNGSGCRSLVRTRVRQLNMDRHPEGGISIQIHGLFSRYMLPCSMLCVCAHGKCACVALLCRSTNAFPHRRVTLARRPLKHMHDPGA